MRFRSLQSQLKKSKFFLPQDQNLVVVEESALNGGARGFEEDAALRAEEEV